ncbi:MAG: hypothetical protein QXK51_11325 [Candidatus Methanomethylicia archaeon]
MPFPLTTEAHIPLKKTAVNSYFPGTATKSMFPSPSDESTTAPYVG